ncbi:transposase, MuDR [Tanacetum coccineum]
MDDIVEVSIPDPSRPTWENMVNSPTIEQDSLKYKLKLRYKGFFNMVNISKFLGLRSISTVSLSQVTQNSWIGIFRFQPVLDLLDNIRKELLNRFDEKRMGVEKWNGTLVPRAKKYLNRISKNLGEYEVCRSNDNHAEVKSKGKRWVVMLDEKKCSCRVWQVKGMSCVHAAAFIAFIRESWDNYVDPYFTIKKFKDAYALEVATMPGKDNLVHLQTEDKIYPPVIKRPIGRPRKKRIVAANEPKKENSASNVVDMDIIKSHAKIRPLKVLIWVQHPILKREGEKNKKSS